jgi:CRP-like cAMP-binding protein
MGGLHLVGSQAAALRVSTQGLAANRLLAALPSADLERWRPHLEQVEMPLGQVLYESGSTPSHVYFPTTAIVALLYVMENGASAEIAVAGNEGVVGISSFMGAAPRPAARWCNVPAAGFGWQPTSSRRSSSDPQR